MLSGGSEAASRVLSPVPFCYERRTGRKLIWTSCLVACLWLDGSAWDEVAGELEALVHRAGARVG